MLLKRIRQRHGRELGENCFLKECWDIDCIEESMIIVSRAKTCFPVQGYDLLPVHDKHLVLVQPDTPFVQEEHSRVREDHHLCFHTSTCSSIARRQASSCDRRIGGFLVAQQSPYETEQR